VSPILAAVLKRDRAIVAFGLAGVATLSWTYLIYMDWGMRHMDVGIDMIIMPAMSIGPPGILSSCF
jgi:predicted metal-binding membrane protein